MAVHDSNTILSSRRTNDAILPRSATNNTVLVAKMTQFTGSFTQASVFTNIYGEFVAAISCSEIGGPAGGNTVVYIQDSPDDDSVADADALWFNLETLTTLTGAATAVARITGSHFTRMRISGSTLAGASDSGSIWVPVEGPQ